MNIRYSLGVGRNLEAKRSEPLARTRMLFLLIIGLVLATEAEAYSPDPMRSIGWWVHADIKSWTQVGFLIFTPVEVALMVVAFCWAMHRISAAKAVRFVPGTLMTPLIAFTAVIALGVLNGYASGGDMRIALWEVRGFLMMIAVYLLTGLLIRTKQHLHELNWVILIAATILTIDNVLRYFILLRGAPENDLSYDHTDSVVLCFASILCLFLLFLSDSRVQRRYAMVLLPVMLFAMEIMKRRAAFAVLGIGMLVFAIVLLRLRPRMFIAFIVPLLLVCSVYLAIFWHNESIWGQPARAVSSMISPDPRDASSNLYRDLEKLDIEANIATSKLLGLGFGKQFVFYVPLPDLSFWPFWHYTPHNAVLWIWLKDGALGFAAFFWLSGQALHDGATAIATQREQWEGFQRWLKGKPRRKRTAPTKSVPSQSHAAWETPATTDGTALAGERAAYERDTNTAPAPDAAPPWKRRRRKVALTASGAGATALLATMICLIPMQIAYSYVDLGLTSDRCMLLFGLALGILARARPLFDLPAVDTPAPKRHRRYLDHTPHPSPQRGASATGAHSTPPADRRTPVGQVGR